jgi:protein-tyrosine phosphatase
MNGEKTSLHHQKSYWVIPERFRAGEYPGAVDEGEARVKIRCLLDKGLISFLDLTQPGEYDLVPYHDLLIDEANRCNITVYYHRIPIQDFTPPARETMVAILDALDSELTGGRNIYLHCFGGKGRTGTVVGCYLVRHGMAGKDALMMIQELRKEISLQAENSPETDEQRRMVLEWKIGQ